MSQPLMGQGEFAQVKEHLTAALHKPPMGWNPVGDHEIYVALADIAAVQRDSAGLAAYAARADDVSRSLGHTLYRALATRALGILAWIEQDAQRAEALLLDSLRVFEELGAAWQAGRTLFDLGELCAAAQNNAASQAYYSRAALAFEQLRATPLAQQVRTRLLSVSN